jgi:Fungal Zn(2)-Cys(6) binuclear cluster domain
VTNSNTVSIPCLLRTCDIMASSAEHAVEAPRRRRRSARSCQECRRRKVKCDRKEPCNHCVLSKNNCVYGLEPARILLPLERRNPPCYSPVSDITATYGSETAHNQDIAASGEIEIQQQFEIPGSREIYRNRAAILPPNPAHPALNEIPELSDIVHRIRSLERQLPSNYTPSSITGGVEPSSNSYSRDISHTHDKRLFLNKSRLYGQSHWSSGAHVVSLPKDQPFLNTL